MVKDLTTRTTCRVCGSDRLTPYADLGVQPLANAFLRGDELSAPEFTAPLVVQVCHHCGLSQLTHVVSPARLYTHYPFSSGVTIPWRQHCERLARTHEKHAHGEAHFVVDIAANDGAMLELFRERGHRVLGIEPADVREQATVPMLGEFWSFEVARRVREAQGPADLVLATNVLGHVDDVEDFLRGVKFLLARSGACVIECPHIGPLLRLTAFDTIYHEHLSYWSLQPLQVLAQRFGLLVYDVEPQAIHGGTMRYWLAHADQRKPRGSVFELAAREREDRLHDVATYAGFQGAVDRLIGLLRDDLAVPHLSGFAASAKGNVLLNATGATLERIYDDAPEKQGLYTPGRHIPVEAPGDLSGVPHLVLLSWNWAMALKDRARALGFRGKFLTPIPFPRWEPA